jgi:phospholipase C
VIPLGHTPDRTPRDISHSFQSAIKAIDGGAMDQFDLIPNYFALARYFTLADAMFSSLTGPSFPNHLYTVGAQSGGAINNPANSGGKWGCDSDDGSTVADAREQESTWLVARWTLPHLYQLEPFHESGFVAPSNVWRPHSAAVSSDAVQRDERTGLTGRALDRLRL